MGESQLLQHKITQKLPETYMLRTFPLHQPKTPAAGSHQALTVRAESHCLAGRNMENQTVMCLGLLGGRPVPTSLTTRGASI